MRVSMPSHGFGLVSAEAQVRSGLRRAYQSESGALILGVVAPGVTMVQRSFEDFDRAGQVPALLAETGELQAGPAGGRENVLVLADRHLPGLATR